MSHLYLSHQPKINGVGIARFSELPYRVVHIKYKQDHMFLTDKLEEIQQLLWWRKEHMVSTKMVIYQDMINSYCLVGYNSIHVKPYGKHTGINAQLIIAVVDQT